MGLGVGIFLAALGAVLAFAVDVTVSGVNLHIVGWVLMGAGLLGIILEVALFAPRRRVVPIYGQPVARPVVRDEYR